MKAIMYHYVRPDDEKLPYFRHLHVEDFEQQLDYFAREFGFVSQADFLDSIATATERPGVVLTFDDGLQDHVRYVLPRLAQRGLWDIFYVPTGVYSNGAMLDVHRVHLLLGMHGGAAVFAALRALVDEAMLTHAGVREFQREPYKRQSHDEFAGLVKKTLNFYIGYEHRPAVMRALLRRLLPDEAAWAASYYMAPSELRALREAGMMVGSHTVNHPVMSKLGEPAQAREIAESFAFLEAATGSLPVKTFCYPYGGYHTFTPATEKLLEELGSRFSFNVEPADIDSAFLTRRLQALPRYDCNQFSFGACRAIDN